MTVDVNKRAQNYAALFGTPLGEAVLKDLREIKNAVPRDMSHEILAHLEGQRCVLRYIEELIRYGNSKKTTKTVIAKTTTKENK